MSSAQTIITMGALMLLTFAVFNMNKMLADADVTLAQDRYKLEALSIMNSYMERASNYAFDQATSDTTKEYSGVLTTQFVLPNHLGFDAGETVYDDINDFDDFMDLTPHVETGRSGVQYTMSFDVDYVDVTAGKFIHSSNRTYHKRMRIKIYDNYDPPLIYKNVGLGTVKDTLSMSFVYSQIWIN